MNRPYWQRVMCDCSTRNRFADTSPIWKACHELPYRSRRPSTLLSRKVKSSARRLKHIPLMLAPRVMMIPSMVTLAPVMRNSSVAVPSKLMVTVPGSANQYRLAGRLTKVVAVYR